LIILYNISYALRLRDPLRFDSHPSESVTSFSTAKISGEHSVERLSKIKNIGFAD
jgi:hypothetical protein